MANQGPQHRSTPPADAIRRLELDRRLRLAFIAGAEDRSRADQGRGLTTVELRAVLRRYPGDLPARRSPVTGPAPRPSAIA